MSTKPSSQEDPQSFSPFPPEFAPITGYFFFQPEDRKHVVTAVNGGGLATDPLRTDTPTLTILDRTWHFRIFVDRFDRSPNPRCAIQTDNGGFFLTALGGGGRITDVLSADQTTIGPDETFHIVPSQPDNGFVFAIQTASGNFFTAVGAGGQATNAFHTDATVVSTWEKFYIGKLGLGSGFHYLITVNGVPAPIYATNGGDETSGSLILSGADPSWASFLLTLLDDGSYNIQTSRGFYLTAIGGGVSEGSPTSDAIQTNVTIPLEWEKFNIINEGDGTYTIQTISGRFIAFSGQAAGNIFETVVDKNDGAARFTFSMTAIPSAAIVAKP